MRWKRVVIGAVLGGMLGLAGQLVTDFWIFFDGTFDRILGIYGQRQNQARQVLYQLDLLYWLVQRGEIASRTALIVAFLCVSATLAFDRKEKSSAVKSPARQTNIAENSVTEPKDQQSVAEARDEPVKIETGEQAAVLKSAPKKEHIEASE